MLRLQCGAMFEEDPTIGWQVKCGGNFCRLDGANLYVYCAAKPSSLTRIGPTLTHNAEPRSSKATRYNLVGHGLTSRICVRAHYECVHREPTSYTLPGYLATHSDLPRGMSGARRPS